MRAHIHAHTLPCTGSGIGSPVLHPGTMCACGIFKFAAIFLFFQNSCVYVYKYIHLCCMNAFDCFRTQSLCHYACAYYGRTGIQYVLGLPMLCNWIRMGEWECDCVHLHVQIRNIKSTEYKGSKILRLQVPNLQEPERERKLGANCIALWCFVVD